MPKSGAIDISYTQKLLDIGVILLEEYKGSKIHHKMKCSTCGFEYNATPLSKIQNHKKYPNSNGCSKCQRVREDEKYADTRLNVLKILEDNDLIVLTEGYRGERKNVYEKIRVRNKVCGHEFDMCIGNFLHRQQSSNCIICGIKQRSTQLTQTVRDRHEEWLKTATEWQIYKYQVELYTKQSYRAYGHLINPNNLQRGVAGGDGNHHLDHIISKRFCFENNIPPELCGHKDNLRMIGWLENIQKHTRIVTDIPTIFVQYISAKSIEMDNFEEDMSSEELKILNEI